MAKKEEEPKTVLERTYNVPLRRRWVNVPKYKRAKKAVTTLKVFLEKHMKPGMDEKGKIQLKLGKHLNDELWKHGIRNPPHHIKVVAKKDDKGLVFAELEGAPVEKETSKETKKEEKGLAKKLEEKKEETGKEEKKKEEKEKLEAIKKEAPKAPVKAPSIPKQVEKKVTGPANK